VHTKKNELAPNSAAAKKFGAAASRILLSAPAGFGPHQPKK